MYYPIEFQNMQDLLNVIETNWVVLTSQDGKILDTSGNLQSFANLSLANAVRFDKNDPSANEVIARHAKDNIVLTKQSIFTFADYYEIADEAQTVDDFAGDLIDTSKAKISNSATIKYYAPKTITITEETKDFAVNDTLENDNGTKLKVATLGEGDTSPIGTLTIVAGGKYLSRKDTIMVVSTTGTTAAGSDIISVNVTSWEEA